MKKQSGLVSDSTNPQDQLKYKIAISGAAETGHCAPDALEKTEKLGAILAQNNIITVTGATIGAPYWAAKGAKMAGGIVIGFSPAASKLAHVKSYHLPVDYHDIIVYTGFEYSGRNLILVRSCDAMITVCGRMGTLNEFTIAFEDQKPIGVLTGTGGTADMLEEILDRAHRGHGKVVFDSDPQALVEKLIEVIKQDEKEIAS
ncbi:MAG: hypothetical protein RIQ54_183 [Candidatus Parcubacteria bacterium]|jgi:uncharacterized protein (TIGR00725 family)